MIALMVADPLTHQQQPSVHSSRSNEPASASTPAGKIARQETSAALGLGLDMLSHRVSQENSEKLQAEYQKHKYLYTHVYIPDSRAQALKNQVASRPLSSSSSSSQLRLPAALPGNSWQRQRQIDTYRHRYRYR